jgi:hypothetical protein
MTNDENRMTKLMSATPTQHLPKLRTFEVIVKNWYPPHSGIYAARSRAKAKYMAWQSARAAGFDLVKFGDLKVRRVPEFDPIGHKLTWGSDWTWAALLLQEHQRLGQS